MPRTVYALALSVLLVGAQALAAPPGYTPLPSADGEGASGLRVRVLRYEGNTNGGMVVSLHNPTASRRAFAAKGLYFVPKMKPEEAPQRLGAAGPVSVLRDKAWVPEDSLTVEPGVTLEVRLEVFCIDSHRSSPSPKTPFRLAKARLPASVSGPIEAGTKTILQGHSARSAREAADEVQQHIWTTRDKAWVPVEGERANERRSGEEADERIEFDPQRRKSR